MGSIEPQYCSDRFVYTHTSPTHGTGIFAKEDLAPGTIWWYPEAETTLYFGRDLYHRIRVASKIHTTWKLLLDTIDMYCYYDRQRDALVFCLCNARYCNHDDTPNSVLAKGSLKDIPHYDAMQVVGLVKKDHEIFENYHEYDQPVWSRTCGDFLNPQLGDLDAGFEDEVIKPGLMEIVMTKEQVATYLRSNRQTPLHQSLEMCWKANGVTENGGWRIKVPEVAKEE